MLANRYRIEDEIGKGGMGIVYKGMDTQSGQSVAIKHLKAELTSTELIERFKREGEALRELNHPNIVKMLDAVEENGNHYLIMEYLAGGDLSGLLKQERLPINRVLQLAIDICDALTRAHRLNIIHRDLKPANVLIATDGTPRLTDFGIARFSEKDRVTDTSVIMGTLDYIAPEMLNGEQADTRTDVWALGVLLFEMLTGQTPFGTGNRINKFYAIAMQPVPDIEALNPDVPIALADLVYRMLEKDPPARMASVRHVGAALEDILYGRSTDNPISIYEPRFATPVPTHWQSRKDNLPSQTTPFIGRETELAELSKMLDKPEIRLVTIVAAGGMGKTRLALTVAERYVSETERISQTSQSFADGVYFVELAPLSDPQHIVASVAAAMDYQFQATNQDEKQQLLDFLRNKRLLLVLDNYEHLIEAASFVTEILQAALHVKVLVTSRQRLSQSGETVFNLEGMDFPQWLTPDDALEYAAVNLFLQGAKRAKPDFELSADNLEAIARICQLVEGLPLAILLAASWLYILHPDEVAAEIAHGIEFLETDLSDMPQRHRSIRAVFDYSWNLMGEAERTVFMKLSVFRGGFAREAAEAVADANLRTLMNLTSKSLLRRDVTTGRYDIHELLRQYSEKRLLEQGTLADITHDAAAAFFINFLQTRNPQTMSKSYSVILTEIDPDFENIRNVWIRLVSQQRYTALNAMLPGLYDYWYLRGRWLEGIALFESAWLDVAPTDASVSKDQRLFLANLSEKLGFVFHMQGRWNNASRYTTAGIQFAQSVNAQHLVATIARHQGTVHRYRGEFAQAQSAFEKSYEAATSINHPALIVMSLIALGNVQRHLKEYATARETYARALVLAESSPELGFERLLVHMSDGVVDYLTGNYNAAFEKFWRAVEYDKDASNTWGRANDYALLSLVAVRQADYAAAREYIAEALQLAYKTHSFSLFLKIVVAVAHLQFALGDTKRVPILLGLVMNHPSYQIEVAEFADILYQQISATIEKQTFDMAYNQGKSLDLETVVGELLTEFGVGA